MPTIPFKEAIANRLRRDAEYRKAYLAEAAGIDDEPERAHAMFRDYAEACGIVSEGPDSGWGIHFDYPEGCFSNADIEEKLFEVAAVELALWFADNGSAYKK